MSSLRRLAKDHAALRAALPPNYLFPPTDDADSLPDDLTQLSIQLTGSDGTPYSSGLWLLHLRIPHDYPKSPPKATFKTRIFHPNVEESTGAVCLETLKRDWDPKLTLKDILVTISCLLIQPNPDSALNEKAGVLVREDYEGFARQAKLMTRIHAPIPASLKELVNEARSRGEEGSVPASKTKAKRSVSTPLQKLKEDVKTTVVEVSGSDESAESHKENDPSRKLVKAQCEIPEPRKPILENAHLTMPPVSIERQDGAMLAPKRKATQADTTEERPRKSPKHTYHSLAIGQEMNPATSDQNNTGVALIEAPDDDCSSLIISTQLTTRKEPTKSKYRPYARIGIRRL